MKRSQIALAAVVIVGSGLALVPVTMGSAAPVRPWMNTALPPDQRAKLLVQAMTLDEKLGMVNGWPDGVSPPPTTDRLIGVGFIPGVPPMGTMRY